MQIPIGLTHQLKKDYQKYLIDVVLTNQEVTLTLSQEWCTTMNTSLYFAKFQKFVNFSYLKVVKVILNSC